MARLENIEKWSITCCRRWFCSSQIWWNCGVRRTGGELFGCRRWQQHYLEKHLNRRKSVARVPANSLPIFVHLLFWIFPLKGSSRLWVRSDRETAVSDGSTNEVFLCLSEQEEFKVSFVGQETSASPTDDASEFPSFPESDCFLEMMQICHLLLFHLSCRRSVTLFLFCFCFDILLFFHFKSFKYLCMIIYIFCCCQQSLLCWAKHTLKSTFSIKHVTKVILHSLFSCIILSELLSSSPQQTSYLKRRTFYWSHSQEIYIIPAAKNVKKTTEMENQEWY